MTNRIKDKEEKEEYKKKMFKKYGFKYEVNARKKRIKTSGSLGYLRQEKVVMSKDKPAPYQEVRTRRSNAGDKFLKEDKEKLEALKRLTDD